MNLDSRLILFHLTCGGEKWQNLTWKSRGVERKVNMSLLLESVKYGSGEIILFYCSSQFKRKF